MKPPPHRRGTQLPPLHLLEGPSPSGFPHGEDFGNGPCRPSSLAGEEGDGGALVRRIPPSSSVGTGGGGEDDDLARGMGCDAPAMGKRG